MLVSSLVQGTLVGHRIWGSVCPRKWFLMIGVSEAISFSLIFGTPSFLVSTAFSFFSDLSVSISFFLVLHGRIKIHIGPLFL